MLQQLSKISLDEQKKNEYSLNHFRYSFTAGNFEQLEELLDDQGIFFNNMNKTRALAHIHKFLFSKYNLGSLWLEVKEGYSMDATPGEHVIEFRFMKMDPFTSPELCAYNFGDAPRKEFKELVVRIALRFKQGKIIGLRIPKKVIQSIDSMVIQN